MLAAQGVGAMLTMPVAGKLTDRIGAGPSCASGVALVLLGTLPFAFVADDVPAGCSSCGLFLRGAGMGATLMPAMAAAYQALPEAAVARAASALEIVQRAGATLGIALLAVILQLSLPLQPERARGRPARGRASPWPPPPRPRSCGRWSSPR